MRDLGSDRLGNPGALVSSGLQSDINTVVHMDCPGSHGSGWRGRIRGEEGVELRFIFGGFLYMPSFCYGLETCMEGFLCCIFCVLCGRGMGYRLVTYLAKAWE